MNEIDLRRFDLNLLIVFEVLMIERNVTRAAERLGRTQSAVSHSLSRLRKQLSDPLLIKAGVRMQPTAFALDLLEQARPLLRGMQRVLSPRQIFDPANSRRLFRIAAADFMQTMFSSLLTRLRSEAPGVCVEWVSPRDPLLLDLAEGQIDIAIMPTAPSRMPEGITGEAVGTLQWRCFGARDIRPLPNGESQAWTRWPHLAIRTSDVLTSPVQLAASAAGLERTVAGWVPHFLYRADSGEFGPAGHDAGDHRGRVGLSVSAGEQGGAISDCRAPSSHALERQPKGRSRDRVVARSVGRPSSKAICWRTDMIANTHAH